MKRLSVPVKNLVIEWRHKPNLAVYTKMDQIGIHFADNYPDWQRSPLTLEIRNKKSKRRFFMSYRRCFFEVIEPTDNDVGGELDRARKLFDRFSGDLVISKLERVGIRQWAAFERDEPFNEVVRRANRKFQPQDQRFVELLRGNVVDVGYVADVRTEQGWNYRLHVGPMEKPQWFEIVPHEEGMFSSSEKLGEYRKAFPDRFLFVDIDCFKEDVAVSDLPALVSEIRSTSSKIMTDLHKYYQED
ncbi:MAG: hypothetical protein A2V98_20300 [Planctomycetes bacterium RBG_16_64_12]|nr:MAG: hypothetical protein A2V98_20300 [Planctomycetes bacterium RBG_16_64_12]